MSGLSHFRARHFGAASFFSIAGGTGAIAAVSRKARLFIMNVGKMMGM